MSNQANSEYLTRRGNAPHVELLNAANEQMKITELRLRKLLTAKAQGSTAAGPSAAAHAAAVRAGLLHAHLGAESMDITFSVHIYMYTLHQ